MRAVIFSIIAILLTTHAHAQQVPPPAGTDLSAAKKQVYAVFGEEIKAARTAFLKTKLAEKLIETAQQTPVASRSGEKFQLYQIAIETAAEAGEFGMALGAISKCAENFYFDELTAQAKLIKKKSHLIAGADSVKHVMITADKAVEAERYDVAKGVVEVAVKACRKSHRPGLQDVLDQREYVRKATTAWVAAKKAGVILVNNPNDMNASMIRGRYLCLFRNDWQQGLQLLKVTADKELGQIVDMEFKRQKSPKDVLQLGDAWWAWVEADKKKREDFLGSAKFWYERSLSAISGLDKRRVEKRLKELERLRLLRLKPAIPPAAIAAGPATSKGRASLAGLSAFALSTGGSIGGWLKQGSSKFVSVRPSDPIPSRFLLKRVKFGGRIATQDDHLQKLSGYKFLSQVYLFNSHISGPGIRHLQGLPLSGLWIQSNVAPDQRVQLSDTSMQLIMDSFPDLGHLKLETAAKMSPETFSKLTRLRLTKLTLHSYPQMNDAAIRRLASMKDLSELQLRYCDLSQVDLKPLIGLSELETLKLPDTNLSSNGFAQFVALPKLRVLEVNGATITDRDVALLTNSNLIGLNLSGTRITDAALASVAKIKTLQRVGLTQTRTTQQGHARLKQLRPKLQININ